MLDSIRHSYLISKGRSRIRYTWEDVQALLMYAKNHPMTESCTVLKWDVETLFYEEKLIKQILVLLKKPDDTGMVCWEETDLGRRKVGLSLARLLGIKRQVFSEKILLPITDDDDVVKKEKSSFRIIADNESISVGLGILFYVDPSSENHEQHEKPAYV